MICGLLDFLHNTGGNMDKDVTLLFGVAPVGYV